MSIPRAVRASQVTKSFGPGAGVFDFDLEVAEGQIVGFIGPSGSGKTTTVRLMTGLLPPDSGTIEVLGQDPARFTMTTRARLGYMAQDSVFYPDLTVAENLNFAASLFGVPYRRQDRLDEMIDFVGLGDATGRLLRDVSGGEKRRLSLAATLIHRPDLIFLDEPTAGVDPILRKRFWDRFEHLADEGSTLVVTTQYVGEAAYCDYVAVLAAGRMLAFEPPDRLRRLAFGGELLDLAFATPPTPEDVAQLAGIGSVGNMTWLDRRTLRLSVDDAGTAGPKISEWAGGRDIQIESSEPYLPPFDDVFVKLIHDLGGSDEPAPTDEAD